MKRTAILLYITFLTFSAFSKDVIHLKNGRTCLGFFFGLFAIAGTVLGRPHPPPIEVIVVRDKEMVMNPAYLSCYRKRAKGKNIISATIGYGIFLAVLLAIQASK